MQKTTRKVAPDGGYAWVACFGVSLVNVSNFFSNFSGKTSPFFLGRIPPSVCIIKCDFTTFVQNWFIIMKLTTWILATSKKVNQFNRSQKHACAIFKKLNEAKNGSCDSEKKGEWLLSITQWKKSQQNQREIYLQHIR